MQPLAAGGLDEAFEPERLEPLAHLDRSRRDGFEADALAGVEVEGEAVGALRRSQLRAPGMDLQHARLDEREETGKVTDRERLVVSDHDAAHQSLVEAGPGCFWKKHFSPVPSGQRTSDNGRSTISGRTQSAISV
jgi:hypothetical protein